MSRWECAYKYIHVCVFVHPSPCSQLRGQNARSALSIQNTNRNRHFLLSLTSISHGSAETLYFCLLGTTGFSELASAS